MNMKTQWDDRLDLGVADGQTDGQLANFDVVQTKAASAGTDALPGGGGVHANRFVWSATKGATQHHTTQHTEE